MGMDPRRLLVHSSNLMRTDVASIRLSDTTARDAQKGCGGTRHPGKKSCFSTALLTASKHLSSPVYFPRLQYNQMLGRHAWNRVIRGSSCTGVEC
jgi:hypothetical protein